MSQAHRGLGIVEEDWTVFIAHLNATLAAQRVPPAEQDEVRAFCAGLKAAIVQG